MNKVDKYSYVSHPRHLPLEVDGKAKKRSIPIRREEYNGEQGNINEESRTLLRKKIENNIHDLGDMRSVLPGGVDVLFLGFREKEVGLTQLRPSMRIRRTLQLQGWSILCKRQKVSSSPTIKSERILLSMFRTIPNALRKSITAISTLRQARLRRKGSKITDKLLT